MERIAIITNDDPRQPRGGAGRIADAQRQALLDAGFEVRVFVAKFAFEKSSLSSRVFRHLKDLKPDATLVNEIKQFQPSVIISHNLTGCGFGTPRALSLPKGTPGAIQSAGARWIHILHDVQLFEPSGHLLDASRVTLWQRVWSNLRRRVFGCPDLVISPTAWLLEEHHRRRFFLKTKTVVLPNPAPLFKEFARMIHDPLRVLYVGRPTHDKGADVVEAVKASVTFPLAVTTVTQKTHEEIMHEMEEADVLLVPSRIEENQPTVILEAASCGLPVIASDKGGIQETLSGRGTVCAVDDTTAWIHALERLKNPEVYQQQSAGMIELAREHDPREYARMFCVLVTSVHLTLPSPS
ncbi:MAG: glycosyltransferase [bacterium]|nr:glycosyltransferase [bacterium]